MLHNFLIDENEPEAGDPIPEDVRHFTTNNACSVPSLGRIVPCSLLDGGEHFDDIARSERRDRRDRRSTNEPLPREKILEFVSSTNRQRPRKKQWHERQRHTSQNPED